METITQPVAVATNVVSYVTTTSMQAGLVTNTNANANENMNATSMSQCGNIMLSGWVLASVSIVVLLMLAIIRFYKWRRMRNATRYGRNGSSRDYRGSEYFELSTPARARKRDTIFSRRNRSRSPRLRY